MKNRKFVIALLISVLMICVSCGSVPVTGRRQIKLVPNSSMLSMSFKQYDEFLKTNTLSKDSKTVATVKRAGERIQKSVEQYLADNGFKDTIKDYDWEFNLVDSPEVNAWAMPGGKVVVYTGIMDVAQTETGLAVVMGHEIAHAIAEHGRERMSQQMIAQMGTSALTVALKDKPDATKKLWSTVFGVGAQYGVMLPFGRLQESEADHMGLIFMAMAGYDPHEATAFWQRMSAANGGKAPPQFMSTHPSDKTRIDNLNKLLPEAMTYYNKTNN